jgi:hypothetical protein
VNASSIPGDGSGAGQIVAVEDYPFATSQIAQTTLRSVQAIGLDERCRSAIGSTVQRIIDEHTEPWGSRSRRGAQVH